MKLGLITDVHEHLKFAELAIEHFQNENVDEILSLGDFCQMEEQLDEICDLFDRHQVRSVWGNHDFGLCQDIRSGNSKGYSPTVCNYAARVEARIQVDEFLFCHVEPWLDTDTLGGLWYYEGEPDTEQKLARIFDCSGWEVAFSGHYHKWLAFTKNGKLDWDGQAVLNLAGERHFVVINACMHGHYAILDTESRLLTPFQVSDN